MTPWRSSASTSITSRPCARRAAVAYPDPARGGPRRRGRRRRRHHGPSARGPPAHPGSRRRGACAPCSASSSTSRWRRPPEMVAIALRIRPADVCSVPERRDEVTTEGGLDVVGQRASVGDAVPPPRRRRPARQPLHRPDPAADRSRRRARRRRDRAPHRPLLRADRSRGDRRRARRHCGTAPSWASPPA